MTSMGEAKLIIKVDTAASAEGSCSACGGYFSINKDRAECGLPVMELRNAFDRHLVDHHTGKDVNQAAAPIVKVDENKF